MPLPDIQIGKCDYMPYELYQVKNHEFIQVESQRCYELNGVPITDNLKYFQCVLNKSWEALPVEEKDTYTDKAISLLQGDGKWDINNPVFIQ